MEKKQSLTFNIVNIAVLGIGLVLLLIQIFSGTSDGSPKPVVFIISSVIQIIALISGGVYLAMGYAKKAAVLYKVYMYALTGVGAMVALNTMTVGSGSIWNSLLIIAVLILAAILASARSFGKIKTFIIAGILLVCQIGMIIVSCKVGTFHLSSVSTLILILEAGIMAVAKYKDKAERGRE